MSNSTGETTTGSDQVADIQIQIDAPEECNSGVVESPVGEDEGCPDETRERNEDGESVIVLKRRRTKDKADALNSKQIVEKVEAELGVDIKAEVTLRKPQEKPTTSVSISGK